MKRILALFLGLAAISAGSPLLHADGPKRVVVVTVTTGFRHSSIGTAEKTLQKLADDSKAFTIVSYVQQPTVNILRKPNPPGKPGEPKADADEKARTRYAEELKRYETEKARYEEAMAKWTPADDEKVKASQAEWNSQMKAAMEQLSPASLSAGKIDGVIFANTTGDLPLPDREGFLKWIEDGHAFMGMHSASDTFHGFRGYIEMLQGEFDHHGPQVGVDLQAGDKAHPANAAIGAQWDLKLEEMYHIKSQDRSKVRSLWYLTHDPNDAAKAGFYPVSWCRMAGKGRVFYTSLGHREDLWSDDPAMKGRENSVETSRQFQAHILGGIKWALGLAEGDATPNPEVK